MIINVQNGKDVITIDIRCHQIRYVKNIAKQGGIFFYDIDETTTGCFQYLYGQDQQVFLESLAEEVTNNMDVKPVDPANLKVLTENEYLAVCAEGR